MAVAIPPLLNHFVTDTHSADQTIYKVFENKIATLELKARALGAIEKICYAALIALVGVVFAVSYNLLVLTGMGPLLMAGTILISPVVFYFAPILGKMARQYSARAEAESQTLSKLRHIAHWGEKEINDFFANNELNIERVNLDALRYIDQKQPKRALLPLIARYESMVDRVDLIRKAFERAPQEVEGGFQAHKALDPAIKQKIRYESQCTHWNSVESEALPTAIKAATLLYLIEHPTNTELDIDPLSSKITGVGVCVPRNYPERMFGKSNGYDEYFRFHPDLHRESITHEEIEKTPIYLIKQRLYPN